MADEACEAECGTRKDGKAHQLPLMMIMRKRKFCDSRNGCSKSSIEGKDRKESAPDHANANMEQPEGVYFL